MNEEQSALVDRLLDLALDEDVGPGDATPLALFPIRTDAASAQGFFVARDEGVMAGGTVVQRLFTRLASRPENVGSVRIDILKNDGTPFAKGDKLLAVSGNASLILTGERVALNLLQRMCAVAKRTQEYVKLTHGTRAGIYDTRKTNPGHRVLDKLAVLAGGGRNHRMGLYDMILIKDNHLAEFGSPAAAVRAARAACRLPVMVEVDTEEQLRDALTAEPDYVLLDNFNAERLAGAVKITDALCAERKLRRPLLEASGGINLSTVAAAAQAGVDRISVGAITHGAGGVDIGLDFD
jgi:nicotinate-nucleotide pyrophosphorylase (carboxylating)